MRRVKSAPANLAEMQNRRRPSILEKTTKPIVIPIIYQNQNQNQNQINIINKERVNNLSLNTIRNIKFAMRQINMFSGDLLQKNLAIEDSIILSGIFEYFTENIFKRDKFQELFNYLLIYLIRYLFNIYIENNIDETRQHFISFETLSTMLHLHS